MMAAIPPSPEDHEVWLALSEHVGGVILGAIGLFLSVTAAVSGFLWRVSSRVTGFAKTQEDHGVRLDEHKEDIAALQATSAQAQITVAALPTRQDIRDLREDMRAQASQTQTQIQSGFENLLRAIGGRKD